MKVSIDNQVNVLVALIAEDRQEVRDHQQAIQNATTFLAAASFGITAFLLGSKSQVPHYHIYADVPIVLLLWRVTLRLMRDLLSVRRCLEAREALLMACDEDRPGVLDPFPPEGKETPRINDNNLLYLPALVTVAIFIKEAMLWFWPVAATSL